MTQMRSELAYLARQAKRAGKIDNTWVHEGKVFIKKIGEERPCRVYIPKDLPT